MAIDLWDKLSVDELEEFNESHVHFPVTLFSHAQSHRTCAGFTPYGSPPSNVKIVCGRINGAVTKMFFNKESVRVIAVMQCALNCLATSITCSPEFRLALFLSDQSLERRHLLWN